MNEGKHYKIGDIVVHNNRDYLEITSFNLNVDGFWGVRYVYSVLIKNTPSMKFAGFFYDLAGFGKRCKKLDDASTKAIKCLFGSERQK